MSKCIFCQGQLNNEEKCVWCGFLQEGKEAIPGTLSYGTKVKNYVVGGVSQMDGESTTYFAYNPEKQQRVLVKEFLPVTLVAPRNNDDVAIQPDKQVLFKNLMYDFAELYNTLKGIDSPAMPKVLEVFALNKTVYAVIEDLKAVPLKDVLIKRGKPYTFKEIRWMLQPIFQLLNHMSKLNLHHGGISDETVMLAPDDTLVLTGFAIQDLRTKNEHIAYKLYEGFSAPEQYHTDGFQGGYTDIYSLACLIYYAVTYKTLTPQQLEGKDAARLFPKYVLETFRYAISANPKERIDSISDFVLMLDGKGTIVKQKAEKIKETDKKRIAIYAAAAVLLLAALIWGFSGINNEEEPQNIPNNETPAPSQTDMPNILPNFVGKEYAQLISDSRYQQNYVFVKLEAYNDNYPAGTVCEQSPIAASEISSGDTVYLTVSMGPKAIYVPRDIIGISFTDASKKLDDAGIKYSIEYVDQTREFVAGMVAGLSASEGSEIDKDTVLTVYVANDKPLATPTPAPTPTPTPKPTPTPTPVPTPTPTPTPTMPSEIQ